MALIALRLLGILKWLREGLTALLGIVRRYPLQAALIASLCLSCWLWLGKTAAEGERDAEIAGRKADRVTYEAAQEKAKARQAEKDRATADTFKSIAERVEYASREYEGAFRAAADSYVGRMRIKAAQGGGCGSVAPGVRPNPGAPDGGQASSHMVALSREDFDRLTGQAMQNAERGAFLTALIDEGLAVVEPGF
jgi:hypothetical protein